MVYKYTKLDVLKELRVKIIKQEDIDAIAKYAENLLSEKIKDEDSEFEQFLIDLACMQDEACWLSYEQLEEMLVMFYMGNNFVCDHLEFAKELRQQARKKIAIDDISRWAHDVWMLKQNVYDIMIKDIAYRLSVMCCDECFEYSYEELLDIANKLIIGEDVKL